MAGTWAKDIVRSVYPNRGKSNKARKLLSRLRAIQIGVEFLAERKVRPMRGPQNIDKFAGRIKWQ